MFHTETSLRPIRLRLLGIHCGSREGPFLVLLSLKVTELTPEGRPFTQWDVCKSDW